MVSDPHIEFPPDFGIITKLTEIHFPTGALFIELFLYGIGSVDAGNRIQAFQVKLQNANFKTPFNGKVIAGFSGDGKNFPGPTKWDKSMSSQAMGSNWTEIDTGSGGGIVPGQSGAMCGTGGLILKPTPPADETGLLSFDLVYSKTGPGHANMFVTTNVDWLSSISAVDMLGGFGNFPYFDQGQGLTLTSLGQPLIKITSDATDEFGNHNTSTKSYNSWGHGMVRTDDAGPNTPRPPPLFKGTTPVNSTINQEFPLVASYSNGVAAIGDPFASGGKHAHYKVQLPVGTKTGLISVTVD